MNMGRRKKDKKENGDNQEGNTEERRPKINLKGDAKRSAVAILLFALSALTLLSFFGAAGSFGEILDKIISSSVGWAKFILPFFLAIAGIVLLFRKETSFYVIRFIGLFVTLLGLTGLFHWFFAAKIMLKTAAKGSGGGYLGYSLDYILEKYLGNAGSLVVILTLLIIGIIVAFDFSIMYLFSKLKKENPPAGGADENADNAEEIKADNLDMVQNENAATIAPEINNTNAEESEAKSPEELEAEKNIKRIEFLDEPDEYETIEGEEGYSSQDSSGNVSFKSAIY
jgi:S-DNA-T family DNA segregation ATPase FtsK/SpoIIIE